MKKLISYVFLLIMSAAIIGCFPTGSSSLTEKIEKQQISVYRVNECRVSDPNILEEAGKDICTRLADRIGFELLKYKIFEKIPGTATRYIDVNIDYYYDPFFQGSILFSPVILAPVLIGSSIYRTATDTPVGIRISTDVFDIRDQSKLTTLKSKLESDELLSQLAAEGKPNKAQLINLISKEIAKSLFEI